MRMILALVFGLVMSAPRLNAQEASIAEVTETPRIATSTSLLPVPSVRNATQYVVKCETFAANGNGEPERISAPSLVILEGQQGSIAVEGERLFATALLIRNEEVWPVLTPVREGTTGSVTVQSLDGDRVHVDATFSISRVTSVEQVPSQAGDESTTQSPTVTTSGWRVVRTVELGKPFEVRDSAEGKGNLVARIVIDRPGVEEAAITPISAAESGEPEDAEVYTVVYAVDDLLEQYAQDLPAEKLKASDFVLLTEMLRNQPNIEWPEGCSMRPFAANRSLVISQTQAGHEKISDLMEEKRTNVADARKLLTR